LTTSLSDHLTLKYGDHSWTITICGKLDSLPINTSYQGILVDASEPVYIRCNHNNSVEEMDAFLAAKAAACKAESIYGGGELQDAPQAIMKGILWNTIFDPIHNRFCTPVTREWCIIKPERPWFGSYVLFTWDTSFAALLSGVQDSALAYQQIYSLLDEMTDENIPCTTSEVNVFADRSQLPVTAYCALKLYHQFGEIHFLHSIFDSLLVHHRWWFKYRDGNGDGLLEWGTNWPIEHDDYRGYLNLAMAESGLDNSPMYDDTNFNPHTHTMELIDVGLNCAYALDAWALAQMAWVLGRKEEAAVLEAEYEDLKVRINQELWNEPLGIYCNKHWDGRFSPVLGPTCFYPMLAGIAPAERAERMVREHLLNEEEFWGEYVIPASSKNHPSFQDNNYWRGRIWAPTNFLVAEGLKRYGYYNEANAVAKKSLKLFIDEWKEENHIHENYNTLTGDGDDVDNADPLYTWGGLLAFLAVSELIEVQPEGGLRIGNLDREPSAVGGFPYHGSRYSVHTGERLIVIRDGQTLIETSVPVQLSSFQSVGNTISFRIIGLESGDLKIYATSGIEEVFIYNGSQAHHYHLDPQAGITIEAFPFS
jgi:hypothetical protein